MLIFIFEFPLKHPNILHESYTRYFLVFYILCVILISKIINNINNNKIKITSMSLLIIIFIILTVPYISSQWNSAKQGLEISNKISELTTKNSLIIVYYSDKYIFDKRDTISLYNFMDRNKSIDYDLFINTILKIDRDTYIYLMDFKNEKNITNLLEKSNIELKLVSKELKLYKMEKNEN